MSALYALLALLLVLPGVTSIQQSRGIDILREAKQKRKRQNHLRQSSASSSPVLTHDRFTTETVQELYLTQRLDHFSPTDIRTYQQRYFYSDVLVDKHNNSTSKNHSSTTTKPTLALLCIGGEGPSLDKSVLVDSVHCSGDMLEFAKTIHDEYSIHLFALEHRYYGESFPKFGWLESPVSSDNLIYLSSKQAIQDIGHFVSMQNAMLLLPKSTTWIAFGGSYPGVLAAWARLKLPHFINMAVSSSAPVQVVLDFVAYNAHVAKEWANPAIGGSRECLQIMQDGYGELEQRIRAATHNQTMRQDIATAFNLCDAEALLDNQNLQLLLGDRMYPFYVQENDASCDSDLCNIHKVCTALVNQVTSSNSSATKNLDALAWMVQQTADFTLCNDIDYDEMLRVLADTSGDYSLEWRPWLWQTCTEMGFYQTCETNSTCPFGQGWHPLRQDLEICQAAFGIPPLQVANNIQRTLEYYGGWDLQATKILSVTGAVDPWSEMALQKTRNSKELPVYSVPKTSHHFWTHPVKPTDEKEVNLAREIIFTTLKGWLDELRPTKHGGNLGQDASLAAEMQ